jgi:hypothetical protein
MRFRVIGYGSLALLLMLGITAFLAYFIIEVVIQNKSLTSILEDFEWTSLKSSWMSYSKNEGTLMTSEYSIASFKDSIDHLSLEYPSQEWLNNFVFDRSVTLENVYLSMDETQAKGDYNIENTLIDITQDTIKTMNPAVLRYLHEIQKTDLSTLSVYMLARLFQDRTQGMAYLRQSYATEKILLNPDYLLSNMQVILNNKFGYNSVNFVKLFMDEEFGMFNDVGLYYWLLVLDYFENNDVENYKFSRTKLENFLKKYNTISVADLVDFVLFDKTNSINLKKLFNDVKTDYFKKVKSLCGGNPCTDEQINLLQWGGNIFNHFLSADKPTPTNDNLSHKLTGKHYLKALT